VLLLLLPLLLHELQSLAGALESHIADVRQLPASALAMD
jgi:hypothetical protein